MKIIRVFPRKTSMTPIDELVRINETPDLLDEADEVHVSCLFSYEKSRAEELATACGATPYAMLYRDETGETSRDWQAFQRQFARPAISHSILKGKTEIQFPKAKECKKQ